MYNLQVQFKNQSKISSVFKAAPVEFMKALQDAVEMAGGQALRATKEVITEGREMWKPPLLTGMMRQNVAIAQKTPLRVVIEPNLSITPYAVYVHEGTNRMKGRPFLEITARTEQKNINAFFNQALDGFVKNLALKLSL